MKQKKSKKEKPERNRPERSGKTDKELIEAELRNEAGDRNRTQTSYEGNIEVTALGDPPVHRETRSMPRTSKAVTDALVKKPRRTNREKSRSGTRKSPSEK